MESKQPLIVIVGPTASGKSELALKVAERFNGEIICADSRTIYKGMDIGTAKPTSKDQRRIKHHLLDVVHPGEFFSAYDFQQQAKIAIDDIRSRKKLPLLVGGTGLYIDSVVFNYKFPKHDHIIRATLSNLTIEELHAYCLKNNVVLPINERNKRHLITAIERKNKKPQRNKQPLANTIIVGIITNKDHLIKKITQRVEYIFSHGVVEEAKKLGKMYGWHNEAMTANIYQTLYHLQNKELTFDQAVTKSIILDQRFAKRQLTWLKRNPYIQWYSLGDAETFLFNMLVKLPQK